MQPINQTFREYNLITKIFIIICAIIAAASIKDFLSVFFLLIHKYEFKYIAISLTTSFATFVLPALIVYTAFSFNRITAYILIAINIFLFLALLVIAYMFFAEKASRLMSLFAFIVIGIQAVIQYPLFQIIKKTRVPKSI